MILTTDIILVAFAFSTVVFAPIGIRTSTLTYDCPAYGNLTIAGGTCPLYASNCVWQTTH